MDFISHISFSVSDLDRAIEFYDSVLKTIGFNRVYTSKTGAGWGPTKEREVFAIKKRVEKIVPPSKGFHLAFHAHDTKTIHDFYNTALKYNGIDNGPPGPRPEYGKNYYAAFVIDPDGYELEVKLFCDQ